ncbi:hypothetical protein M409DRAFT_53803 [Zasmidium cellare ATCC 36951]|uniref:Major facilitator superfamily (MFS) profile domain-containing protein n=1 Tax=Zasmidium cellare ATCC 36951 TaxID=1080233 RepID=A0A6A6CKW1_ZASCE|nr:uncharacterized protein M409DRAFT_53803 [Zasmidium cellare ATCC 36951]KAF2167844.1 hypothetical protein M409DRAFT_53803 [Zasmidium cellare ATCC 36951]
MSGQLEEQEKSSLDRYDQEASTEGTASPHNEKEEEPPARSVHGYKWALVCISLYLSSFLYGLDTTIAADIQAAVIEEFDDVSQLTWIGTGFPLGSVSMTLLMGSCFSRFDMKWLYIGSFLVFEAASALCGAAPDMNALIVGRVIAGLGGSGIYLGNLNYFSVCTTNKERGTYIAGVGFIWGLGSILGPVIGGAFSISSATWRWSFYINLVFAVVCAPVYLFYLPSVSQQPNVPVVQKLKTIDWVGALLWMGFVNAFTIVLTFAGNAWPWKDGRTIATWIAFGVVLAIFIVQQYFALLTTKENRIFPGHLMNSRSQILLYMGTAAATTNLFVPTYYIPIFFQFTNGDSAIMAAVRLLPFILVLIAVNMISGIVLPRIGYYWILYLTTGVFMVIGGSLMLTVDINTGAGNIYGYSVLIAIGSGLTIQTGYAVATMKRGLDGYPEDVPNVVAFQNTAQLGSTLIALVISGQVFQTFAFNGLSRVLAGLNLTDQEIRSAISGTHSAVFESLDAAQREGASGAVTSAIGRVWALSAAAGVVSLVIAPFMKKERLMGLQASAGGG